MELTISIAQLTIDLNHFERNLDKLLYLIGNLPTYPNHLLILPELWSTGFTSDLSNASKFNLELLDQLRAISASRNLYIAGSYILSPSENLYSNRLVIVTPNHLKLPTYDKLHLIASMNEKNWFVAGNHLSIANLFGVKIGLAICYDLRFPELFRRLTSSGVKMFILPSQWPEKRIAHFQKLIAARAIENQTIFVSSNTIGKIGNTLFGGHSMVVDHFGDLQLDLLKKRDHIGTISIDVTKLDKWREKFPVLTDNRNLDSLPIHY